MSCGGASLWEILVVVGVVLGIQGAPFGNDVDSESVDRGSVAGPGATLTFLRRFGYLESLGTNASETLYSEERVTEAIRQMQHYGAVPETGKLDNETLALLTKRRCGVPDIIQGVKAFEGHSRKKRFALGSNGWNKRRLSYRLENWSPNLRPDDVHTDIHKAMKIWGKYAHLTFMNWTDPHHDLVDIAISFGQGHHGDRFPFDGEGGTLAHAYFPQNTPGLSGDIHFDLDEPWYHHEQGVTPPTRGVSFMDVALHELGHSLGLAHSPSQDSVMFPYYKAPPGDGDPKLGYDDIMAMYHLYVSRSLGDGEDENEDVPPRSTTRRSTSTTPKTIPTTPRSYTQKYDPTTPTTPRYAIPSTTYEPSTGESPSPPDLCKGEYDTITFLRNEIFVFSGEYMWRWVEKGQAVGGSYPVHTTRLFPFLEGVKKIDAAFERESDGKMIFLSGGKYWTFDGHSSEGPLPLSDFDIDLPQTGVDAAFVWGKNRKTYFFKGDEYWKYNETLGSIKDSNYPANIQERWRGIPSPITSVFTFKDGKTYFFRGLEFWRFDDHDVHAEKDFPMSAPHYWFNCPK